MISDLLTEGSDAEDPVIKSVLDEDESSILNYYGADDTDMDPDWEPTDTEEPHNTTSLSRVRSNLIVDRDKKPLWQKDPPPTSRTRAQNIVTKNQFRFREGLITE
ncbi:hypothetical protein J6590_099476, partial [Homalodisca vitripennis]